MSHFAVLVIGTTTDTNIDTQLAPFQENNMGDCPQEYLEFEDETETVTSDWETGTSTMVRLIDGTLKNKYQLDESEKALLASGVIVEQEIPYKEIYKDIDTFASEYHSYKKVDDKYGYYTNNNSRWDWWTVGGRWAGSLLLKEGVNKTELPNFSGGWDATSREELLNQNRVDSARLCDIDIEAMIKLENEKVRKEYNLIKEYNLMPYNTDEEKKAKNRFRFNHGFFLSGPERFEAVSILSEDEYAIKFMEYPLAFHSVVENSEWYENGTMGWWGIIQDGMEVSDWNIIVRKRIEDLDPNTLVTVVDCHV